MAEPTRFKRRTLIAAANCLADNHAEFDNLMLQWELEDRVPRSGSLQQKANDLITYALSHPQHSTEDEVNVWDEMIELVARKAVSWPDHPTYAEFVRTLKRQGYELGDENVAIRAALPPIADLPEAEDEVYALLDEFGMTVEKGHLDQAIKNHARGDWAAANGQIRTFMQGIFDEIAKQLEPNQSAKLTSENRRQSLANISPPFFQDSLGEWTSDGKNFVNGLFKRLHGQGPHPGLSDEDDCTFRLHLVLIVARHYLRRARGLVKTR